MKDQRSIDSKKETPYPYRVQLPGFLVNEEDIGIGDMIKRVTSAVGIKPCGDCLRRASALNQWVVFKGRHSNK